MQTSTESFKSFGVELRRLRIAAGLSLMDMQGRVFFSKSHLSKVENGVKAPSTDLARRCDEVLGAEGALKALVQPASSNPGSMSPRRTHVNDRSWPPSGPMPFFHHAWNADLDPLEAWHAIYRDLRKAGQSAPPTLVIPMAASAVDCLQGLALGLRPPRREEALRLASHFGVYAGWMAQENSDDVGAVAWTTRAVELAEAAGDYGLAAYALVRKGLIALYHDDHSTVIQLAQQAQARTTDARILGLAAQREAQGHAMAGDSVVCMRALAEASRHFASVEVTDDPRALTFGTSTLTDPATMVAGWCLFDLGKPVDAVTVLSRELDQVPWNAHRARARWGSRLALSLAGIRELEQACEVIEPILGLASMIDSATIRKDLRKLNSALRRWDSHPRVRELAPRLLAVSTRQC